MRTYAGLLMVVFIFLLAYAMRGDIRLGDRAALMVMKNAKYTDPWVVDQSGIFAFIKCDEERYDVAYDIIATPPEGEEKKKVVVTVCCEMRPLTPEGCTIMK